MREMRSSRHPGWTGFVLPLALLVSPAGAATFVVNSAGDEADINPLDNLCQTFLGTCTLRAAIQQTNATPGADVIQFNVPGTGVHTIQPGTALPTITEAVSIDGYSQPGASPNTLAVGSNALLLIEIDGSLLGNGSGGAGLDITGGGSAVRGLVIHHFRIGSAIRLSSNGNNVVAGNFIGTDPTGSTAALNGSFPVGIGVTSDNNLIGGTAPADRNLVAGMYFFGYPGGSGKGIDLAGNGNVVRGNLIGTNAAATASLQNYDGIFVSSGMHTIGGAMPGAGNVISGNFRWGITLLPAPVGKQTTIQGNFIGTDGTGTAALPNGPGDLYGGGGIGGGGIIGGATMPGSSCVAPCNLISGNSRGGLQVGFPSTILGNFIGTDVTGIAPIPNQLGIDVGNVSGGPTTIGQFAPGAGNVIAFNQGNGVQVAGSTPTLIQGNSIFSNGGLGIDLGVDGVTPSGLPVLSSLTITAGAARIQGTLDATPSTQYRIDFYRNDGCDPSGYGEGKTEAEFDLVTTDGFGHATIDVVLGVPVAATQTITATATDPSGSTSEFSNCVAPVTKLYTVSPCRLADTRNPAGPYGAPALSANVDRSFVITNLCGIPTTAQAVSFNFTITQPTDPGDLRVFPGGGTRPLVSTLNWRSGQTRANNAVVALGTAGDITVHPDQAGGTVQFIIDVNGYFQ
jgi:CSLREA domain-containing protein